MRNSLGLEECYWQCIVFLFSGGDTTASSLRGILMFTIATPRVYQTLEQTIRQAVASGDISSPITTAQAKSLPYNDHQWSDPSKAESSSLGTYLSS